MELTEDQKRLVQSLGSWYKSSDRQFYSYTGAAGTGKTTVIKAFIDALGIQRYISCAYVGKAVTVLSRHGLPASTIHSLIYNVDWVPVKDANGKTIFHDNGQPKMKVEFSLKPELQGDPELVIVDEATMVNDDLCDDILSFGRKTVFIGDNNQLPPVFGVSSVMLNPNFALTKIMRQAENDPIVYLSQRVLHNEPLIPGTYGSSHVYRSLNLGRNWTDYDAIITPLNRIRDHINDHIRYNVLGIRSSIPVIGDKIICRQNDWKRCIEGNIFLTNGMIGEVTDIYRAETKGKSISIDFKPEISNEEFYNLPIDISYITKGYDERKAYGISSAEKFEYAYAVTCHSYQGSEADRVLYIDRFVHDADMTKRLRYTGITRARYKIDITSDIILE